LSRYLLVEDYDKSRYEIDLPLTSNIDYAEIRKELNIPQYVEASNLLLERGLVSIWAARNAATLSSRFQNAAQLKIKKEPIPLLFFGGAAVKLLCPESNDPSTPLCREINDIDLVTSQKRGADLVTLLLALHTFCGTRYYHFVTRGDTRFNALRGGKRYRLRAIDKILDDSLQAGVLDVLVGGINLRHKVEFVQALADSSGSLYTVGLERILLSKCQYIFDVPNNLFPSDRERVEYQLLAYPHYRRDRLLFGMEEKDIKDVSAVFLSHDIGEGNGLVNPNIIRSVLEKDKKFTLTFRLNLENVLRNEEYLKRMGLSCGQVSLILSRVEAMLEAIPKVDKKWSNPWWNEEIETPMIFGKTNAT
jgi:hypothetical protein